MKKKSNFRTELNVRERREAIKNFGKPKYRHQVTLCFGGLKFVKTELEIDRAISRSEIPDLEKFVFEQFSPSFKGLTRVIVHN